MVLVLRTTEEDTSLLRVNKNLTKRTIDMLEYRMSFSTSWDFTECLQFIHLLKEYKVQTLP